MNKRLLSFLIAIFFLIQISVEKVEAARTIPDDLYVSTVKGREAQALDISNNSDPQETGFILTYRLHGRGNQLLNFEYREREDGYIISAANNNERVLKAFATENYARAEILKKPVNNLTEFDDSFIWDVVATENGFYTISSRLTNKCLSYAKDNDHIMMEAKNGQNKQQFRLTTLNGKYLIRSKPFPQRGLDIEFGVAADRNIIAYNYPATPRDNQRWFVLYRPEEDAYFIANALNKSIYMAQNSVGGQPTSRLYTKPYIETMPKSQMYFFEMDSFTADNFPILKISSLAYPTYTLYADGLAGDTNRLSLASPFDPLDQKNRWIFQKYEAIEKPKISNIQIHSNLEGKDFYYAGEKLSVSGDLTATKDAYKMFDLYMKFNTEKPKLQQANIPIPAGQTTTQFNVELDTKDYKEGQSFIEFFARGDSMFISNKVAAEYTIKYPTPTGKASKAKEVPYNSDASEIKPSELVTDLKDEVGSEIEVVGFEDPALINTSKLGEQEVVVLIKNYYKTEKVRTKINVVKTDFAEPVIEGIATTDDSSVRLSVKQNIPFNVAGGIDLQINLSEYVKPLTPSTIQVEIKDQFNHTYETVNEASTTQIFQKIEESPAGSPQVINFSLSEEFVMKILLANQAATDLTFSLTLPLSSENKLKIFSKQSTMRFYLQFR